MDELRQLQQNFLGHLLDHQDESVAASISADTQRRAMQRMGYYAYAYRARLKEVLSDDFERLHAYLGDELFDRLICEYIDRYPSRYPSLRDFGGHMLALVSTLKPFCDYLEIVELTEIELAFNRSFDTGDAAVISWDDCLALSPESWPEMKLKFHDSLDVLSLNTNSFEIWQALSEQQTPPQKISEQQYWLVWRKQLVSRYRSLSKVEAEAIFLMMKGVNFADLCEMLLENFAEQQTAQQALIYLQQWIQDEMVVAVL